MRLGKYRHYKGKFYQVIGIAKHSETLEEIVIYKHIDDDSLWVRPRKMFEEMVEINGKKFPRFEFVE